MAKILFTYEGELATVAILKEMFRHLEYRDCQFGFVRNTDLTAKEINDTDTIIFIRPTSCLAGSLSRKARSAGCRVCTFLDDDLLNYKPITPWRLRGLQHTLENSECLISFSQYLLDKYKPLYPNLKMVHIDMIVNQIYRRDMEEEPVLKAVYAASRDHAELFENIVAEPLHRLAQKYPGRINITFVGCHPQFQAENDEIEVSYIPAMPFDEYREHMLKSRYDIGFAPLRDSEFSRCKYYNKFVEYSMFGICGVYSDVEPYSAVVGSDLGILTENTVDAWFEAMERMIAQKQLRNQFRANLYDFLQAHNSREGFMSRLTENMPEINNPADHSSKCQSLLFGKAKYFMLRPFDKLYFLTYYARHGQLKNR